MLQGNNSVDAVGREIPCTILKHNTCYYNDNQIGAIATCTGSIWNTYEVIVVIGRFPRKLFFVRCVPNDICFGAIATCTGSMYTYDVIV